MSQQTIAAEAGGAASHGAGEHVGRRLGALLCWAVVFADIGTSVYYTPGILFGQFGHLAGFFVTLTLIAFVLLALKYAEVSVRFPEGGGVVTVSARALNPWMGALGGMFILVDYFLTAAISSLSGLQYFQDVYPAIKPYVVITTIIVLILLGLLNWWGIRESATVSLYIAIAAFVSDIVILVAVVATVPLHEIVTLIGGIFSGSELTPITILTGFAGAFLAFSGLESISQLSPVMQRPRSRVVTIALSLVVITVGVTSPLLTILSTTLLDGKHSHLLAHQIANIDPNQFISQLGTAAAGPIIGIATAVIASALLIFASNTAIIGTYHVFLALSRMSFFPKFVEKKDKFRETPYISIALATGIPIAILLFANGQIDLLGQLYAFGLLGAFALTCVSVDALRFRERRGGKQVTLHEEEEEAEAAEDARLAAEAGQPLAQATAPTSYSDVDDDDELDVTAGAPATSRGQALKALSEAWTRAWPTINFALGILTTILVVTAWVTNLISKRDATIFGGSLTVVGMGIAIWHYRTQSRAGTSVVEPTWALSYLPDSVLAIVRTGAKDNKAIIESAFRAAHGRKTLVLFLSSEAPPEPRFMQISDPALRDEQAQEAFRLARSLGQQQGAPVQVYYRIGGMASAAAFWRVARSQEVVADRTTAKDFAGYVSPTYIRYRRHGEAEVVHVILRPREEANGATLAAAPAVTSASLVAPAGRAQPSGQAAAEQSDASDEVFDEEDLRRVDDPHALAPGRGGRPASPEPAQQFAEAPLPDHEHVGDTKPRHKVKMASGMGPGQSGITAIPRPAPQAPRATRMTEPTPIESDDDEVAGWIGMMDEPESAAPVSPSESEPAKGDDPSTPDK